MLYLEVAGHGEDDALASFRPLCNNTTSERDKTITPVRLCKLMLAYLAAVRISDQRLITPTSWRQALAIASAEWRSRGVFVVILGRERLVAAP